VEGKYEDGVARLYSSLERGDRFRLARQYGVSTEDVGTEQLPEGLRAEFEQKYRETQESRILARLTKWFAWLGKIHCRLVCLGLVVGSNFEHFQTFMRPG